MVQHKHKTTEARYNTNVKQTKHGIALALNKRSIVQHKRKTKTITEQHKRKRKTITVQHRRKAKTITEQHKRKTEQAWYNTNIRNKTDRIQQKTQETTYMKTIKT
jgi:hypothetical protein